jgi:epoxyqueuosine reductase
MSLKDDLIAYAHSLGFERVGVASAARLLQGETALGEWVNAGCAGEMEYMERNWATRARPDERLPGARCVISLAMNYYTDGVPRPGEGRIARYAWGRDYHKVIEKRLDAFVRYLQTAAPGAVCKTYVDTGPILERAIAQKAGLGFVGKNTMLITRGLGSYVFIASVLTTLDLPWDTPDERNCGTCTLCIDACPTQAITEPYHLDARRCIAYLTIEAKQEPPAALRDKMGDWLFGCDICQDVCPHNTRLPQSPIPEFQPAQRTGPSLNLSDVLAIQTDEEFDARFQGSPLKRAKRSGLQRSARRILEKTLVSLLGCLLTAQIARADVDIDKVLLTAPELPAACQMIEGSHPVRSEDQVFYDHGVHSDMLPLVLSTRNQSFRCNGDKGTLYYFEYADNGAREKAEHAARLTFWGTANKPTERRPEQVFHWTRFLMILSFKNPQKELLTALLKKLKPLETPAISTTTATP